MGMTKPRENSRGLGLSNLSRENWDQEKCSDACMHLGGCVCVYRRFHTQERVPRSSSSYAVIVRVESKQWIVEMEVAHQVILLVLRSRGAKVSEARVLNKNG
jgi:hypothetical protein